MSATGERGTQAPSFDLMPPEADSLVAQLPRDAPVLLHPDDAPLPEVSDPGVDLGASLGSGERFVPTLEDLAQDWLAAPEPSEEGRDEDGSGALEVARLAAQADAPVATKAPRNVSATEGLEEARPPWAAVDSTAEFSASAVARMEGGLTTSASHDAWESVPPASASVQLDGSTPPGRSRFLLTLGVVAGLMSAAGTYAWFGLGAWGEGPVDEDEAPASGSAQRVVAAPPVEGVGASAAGEEAFDGIVVPPPIDDGLVIERFEVGRPGPGKRCEGPSDRFSRRGDRKIAACYEVAEPHHADRVIVLWDKDGQTVRRGVRQTPRAAQLVSRSYLSLADQPTGTWRVRLVRDDEGSLTELARRRIVID